MVVGHVLPTDLIQHPQLLQVHFLRCEDFLHHKKRQGERGGQNDISLKLPPAQPQALTYDEAKLTNAIFDRLEHSFSISFVSEGEAGREWEREGEGERERDG